MPRPEGWAWHVGLRDTPEDPAAMTADELDQEIEWAYLTEEYDLDEEE